MDNNTTPEIITGSNGELIKKKVIFAPPKHDGIVQITERKDDVIIKNAEVVQNGDYVLVNGYLNKSIVYNTTNKAQLNKLMGNEKEEENKKNEDSDKNDSENEEQGKDDKNNKDDKNKKDDKKGVQCESINSELESMAVDGVVRHTTVWIPFEILIYTKGAVEGNTVTVDKPVIKSLYKDKEILEDGLIVGTIINDLITVSVKVFKN